MIVTEINTGYRAEHKEEMAAIDKEMKLLLDKRYKLGYRIANWTGYLKYLNQEFKQMPLEKRIKQIVRITNSLSEIKKLTYRPFEDLILTIDKDKQEQIDRAQGL